jgi:hypothetical protein
VRELRVDERLQLGDPAPISLPFGRGRARVGRSVSVLHREGVSMLRRVAVGAAALLVAAFVVAGEVKEVTGTVKSVTGGTFVVTDSAAKEWTFAVDSKETLVVAKGGRHKMDALKADGKPALLSEFVAEKDKVVVKYGEKEGKLTAKEVHVKK